VRTLIIQVPRAYNFFIIYWTKIKIYKKKQISFFYILCYIGYDYTVRLVCDYLYDKRPCLTDRLNRGTYRIGRGLSVRCKPDYYYNFASG